mgnify:CR=1 FL=1
MSITLRYEAKFQVDEIPALALDLVATNPTIQHRFTYPGITGTRDASSTVVVDDVYSDTRALAAGTYSLDLRALTSTLGVSKDFNGKKVKGICIIANAANTAGIVVQDHTVNGYLIFATATGEVTVYPGCPMLQIFDGNLAAIDATHKVILFTSADVDAEFQISIAVGP